MPQPETLFVWSRKFAWLPVRLIDGGWEWWISLERRRTRDGWEWRKPADEAATSKEPDYGANF